MNYKKLTEESREIEDDYRTSKKDCLDSISDRHNSDLEKVRKCIFNINKIQKEIDENDKLIDRRLDEVDSLIASLLED